MNDFSKTINTLLNIYYSGGMKAVEESIEKEPLSDATRSEIKQSYAIIAKMKEKRNALAEAKRDGYTTEEWSAEELDRISKQQ